MTKNIRIIPRLDIKGPNLVKGIHLEGLRVLGKPEDFARDYYTNGADELFYMDVVASLYGRNSLTEIVSKTAQNIFVPLTVGGGIRTLEDIRGILRAGADKVAINTAAINNPKLITDGAKTFGSQCIVVSIEAKSKGHGKYEAYTDNGREKTGVDVLEWARRAVDMGAGEILITSIDHEGTGKGYDIELISKVSSSVGVPVIVCGGAGKKEHFLEAVTQGAADAVCAASVFHYHHSEQNIDSGQFKEEGNIEFLKKRNGSGQDKPGKIDLFCISELKEYLMEQGVRCRIH